MKNKKVVIEDVDKIKEYLDGKSNSILNLINNNKTCNYTLFQKYITHSDIITAGKRLGNQSVDKNYLYYLSNEKMLEIEKTQEMESAKQSNIGMPKEFYETLEIPFLERRKGQQTTHHTHYILNDFADVYLVNDSVEYFDIEFTKKVFEKLNKNVPWDFDKYKVNININDDFTPIKISYAIHGLGTEQDIEFHKLRRSIFKTDSFICLIKNDLDNHKKELYIILEKNPIFFTIIGEANSKWEKYLELKNIKDLQKLTLEEKMSSETSEKNRSLQSKWKDMLAAEMMNYTSNENEIFCPLTYITADYNNLKTLYRASHIKGFTNCDSDEAYDINNGLLLCANADALFDKHLITIDENKNIVFSFVLEHDEKLKQVLRLNNEIFKAILNDKRMLYLKYHKKEFEKKEILRKLGTIDEDIDLEKD